MLVFLFSFLLIFGQFDLHEAEECSLPKYEEKDIDWNMINTHWYQTLNADNPVNDYIKCFVLLGATQIGDDVILSVIDVQGKGREPVFHDDIPVHWIRQNNSFYLFDLKMEEKWLEDVKETSVSQSSKMKAREGKKIVDDVFKEYLTFYSDHEKYILSLQCSNTGRKMLYVLTPKPYPDPEVVLQVHNKLIEIGLGWEKVPLFLSGCTDLDFQSSNI